jgi:hypothetical protein
MLIRECGHNLPFQEQSNEYQLEQCRFAALKVSDGDLAKLAKAIELAKADWRDLVIDAGFQNITAHEEWLPEQKWSADGTRQSHVTALSEPPWTQKLSPKRRIKVGPKLSAETQRRVELLFSPEQQKTAAGALMLLCGHQILPKADEFELEQCRFAALKVSDGNLAKRHEAIEVAEINLTDILRAAGFEDPTTHQAWLPDRKW